MEIQVSPQRIPVLLDCDVLVCGAGPAGCAAAISAARLGKKVVLLERWSFPGGMATAGLVNILHTSDREKEVIFGIVNELIERCKQRGFVYTFPDFPHSHETQEIESEGFKVVWDDMLKEAGVQPIYTLVAGDVVTDGDRITAVLCDTKTGRKAITARMFIDCTGDGDIAAKAGVPFDYGRDEDGLVQGMTLIYRLMDLDRARVDGISDEENTMYVQAMAQARDRGELPTYGGVFFPAYSTRGAHPNMNPASGHPLDELDLTRCLVQTRRQLHQYLDFWRTHVPGFERASIATSAAAMGVRESRRFHCRERLETQDVLGCRKREDAVGHGFWMIDIHDPKGSGYTTWFESLKNPTKVMFPAGESYHIPYGMMVPEQFSNLLIAGRCASSSHEAHASVRLQSHCMVMGQGAGAAVSLALDHGTSVQDVDMTELKTTLRSAGVYIQY